VLVRGQRHGQQVGQAAVAGLELADSLDEPGEAAPRVGVGQGLLGGPSVLGDLLGERGGDELLAGREPPVERGDADSGPRGDRLERRLQALLGEDVPGHRHDRGPVARGVGAQPARGLRVPSALGISAPGIPRHARCARQIAQGRVAGRHPHMIDDLEGTLRT